MSASDTAATMPYRRLGNTGLKVSVLSLGSWISFDNQMGLEPALQCMDAAYQRGCNFFDNAEVYAAGKSETIMGEAIRQLGWPRWSYVLTTKLFWGIHEESAGINVNVRNTLNRKYLLQAIDGSLERLGHDFVDVVYCHRADPQTPIGETVWAMSDIEFAERHHLHAPVTEQSEYNLFNRRIEREYARLNADHHYGNTIWSPLASGLLTGKYRNGVPEGSRAALSGYGWLAKRLANPATNERVGRLEPIAAELGCSLAQLALAWCAANPDVSTVITGASRPEQVVENFAALDVLAQLTPEVLARIEAAVA